MTVPTADRSQAGRTVGVVESDADSARARQARDALRDADMAVTSIPPGTLEGLSGVDALVVPHDPPAVDATAVLADVRAATPAVPVVVFADTPVAVHEAIHDHPQARFVDASPAAATDLLVSRVRAAVPDEPDADAFVDMFDAAVAVFDPDSRRILATNGAFRRRWDRDAEGRLDDLLAQPLRDEGHPETLVELARGIDQVAEWHCERPDGSRFKATVQVRVDTERDRGYLVAEAPATDTATEDESMLDTLLDHTPMSIYFKDEQSRHVAVSDALLEPVVESPEGKRMHTRADVIGKTDFDLYPTELAEQTVEDDREVMATGEPITDTLEQVEPPDGPPLYFSTAKAPWYDPEGRLLGIVGITREVTQRERHKAQLERQNERLGRFADIISHDLRNPLNVATGRIELYERTGDAAELDDVAAMHERMDGIIDDVLTFARQGDRVTDPEPVDGSALAAEAWAAVDTGDATLERDWAHDIEADRARLKRVFENLFRNALEHGRATTVRAGTLDGGDGFYVADDGPGIPVDEREDVFEHGYTTSDEGTGFGLPIVREIGEAHGWDVVVTESDDGGARFEFRDVTRA